jgi:hypothetical protein
MSQLQQQQRQRNHQQLVMQPLVNITTSYPVKQKALQQLLQRQRCSSCCRGSAAAAAAEAAQQQLLSGTQSSPLSSLLAADAQLRTIAQVYGTVQSLHHKAVLQKLQQYGPCDASLAGFAYAFAAEALGKQWTAQPGAVITTQKLKAAARSLQDCIGSVKVRTKVMPADSVTTALELMAIDLLKACNCGPGNPSAGDATLLDDLCLLVLPDLGTLLLESLNPAAAAAASLPSAARQAVQWIGSQCRGSAQDLWSSSLFTLGGKGRVHGARATDSFEAIHEQLLVQLLQQGRQQHQTAADSRQQPVRLANVEALTAQLGHRWAQIMICGKCTWVALCSCSFGAVAANACCFML